MKKVMVFTVVVSMLFLGVPAPTDAGVVAGMATDADSKSRPTDYGLHPAGTSARERTEAI